MLCYKADFASINQEIHLVLRCDNDDYSLALEEILDITLCEKNSSGNQGILMCTHLKIVHSPYIRVHMQASSVLQISYFALRFPSRYPELLTVESYEEMQARASITPFSLGYVASYADRIEYTLDNFQVAAFQVEVVSPPPPPPTLLSPPSNTSVPSNSSTQYKIVSILQTTDRLQALSNCLDGTFDPEVRKAKERDP